MAITSKPGLDPNSHSGNDSRGGFFAFHGIWAPGVRAFRSLTFSVKATLIMLAMAVPIAVLGYVITSVRLAWVIHVLLPVTSQSPPTCTARVRSEPRSDPVFGSVKTAVGRISPLASFGSHCAFCSGVPPHKISSAAISLRVPSDPTPM